MASSKSTLEKQLVALRQQELKKRQEGQDVQKSLADKRARIKKLEEARNHAKNARDTSEALRGYLERTTQGEWVGANWGSFGGYIHGEKGVNIANDLHSALDAYVGEFDSEIARLRAECGNLDSLVGGINDFLSDLARQVSNLQKRIMNCD